MQRTIMCQAHIYDPIWWEMLPFCLVRMMKRFNDQQGHLQPHKCTFNYRSIRTRRVVEQACRRIKARCQILEKSNINDPRFAANIALVCCALHNFCEWWCAPAGASWEVNLANYQPGPRDLFAVYSNSTGEIVRQKLAQHIHQIHPID